jgi:hypothetical protein
MSVMRHDNQYTICLAAFLLLTFCVGCSDPDKNAGSIPGSTLPAVISAAPLSGAVGACPNTIITATFTQPMNGATLNATTFTVTGPMGATVSGQVTYDSGSNTAIFSPAGPLGLATIYTASITTGATNAYGIHLAGSFTWSFTTGIATCSGVGAPTVVAVTPSNGACPNSTVTGTFSEAMNPATISASTFTLAGPGSAGTVTYDVPNLTATFTPAASLALNTLYTATITTGAQDLLRVGLASDFVWTFTTSAAPCQAPVPLNSAGRFVGLAGSTVTNTGPTIITGGDIGLSPGSAVTGFPPGTLTPPAVMHVTDPIAAQAELDLTAAYLYAAGLPGGAVLPGNMSGLTFAPGLYTNASTVQLSAGTVTLDAGGDPNAVFIFQIGSTLTTIGSTQVVLAGGAQAKNVFWQVGTSATLGTNSIFMGTIMALQSVTLDTGATLTGRALARNGAVTMDSNIITAP